MRTVSFKNVGSPNTPQEVKRLRRENMDYCRKMGQPIVWRHFYSLEDVDSGLAKPCPACFDTIYKQVRGDCPVCYGYGFASVEDNPDPLWITEDGLIVESDSQPSETIRAPRYGGFHVPYLTWMVEPDIAEDVFGINKQGVMIKTYDAQGVAPWFPSMGDNDLCVNVAVGGDGFTILETYDRFQLKQVQQITLRGFGKQVRAKVDGQPHQVQQTFQMSKGIVGTQIYNVPVDEPWY